MQNFFFEVTGTFPYRCIDAQFGGGLVDRDMALIVDGGERVDQWSEIDTSVFPERYLPERHRAAAPSVEGVGTVRVQHLILQIDVEKIGGETADCLQAIRLRAEFEVGRFVDQTEVGPVDTFEDF